MRALWATAIVALTLCANTACAVQGEVSLGVSNLSLGPNGVWYQDGHPYDAHLTSPSLGLGLRSDGEPGFGWRAGYLLLGRVTSDAMASASDDDYLSGANAWPLSHWHGSGSVQGAYGGLLYRFMLFHRLPVDLEAGLYAYLATWDMSVPDWRRCQTCAPESITVSHQTKVQATPYFGIAFGPLAFLYYHNISADGDQYPAIYSGDAVQMQLRFCFGRQLKMC